MQRLFLALVCSGVVMGAGTSIAHAADGRAANEWFDEGADARTRELWMKYSAELAFHISEQSNAVYSPMFEFEYRLLQNLSLQALYGFSMVSGFGPDVVQSGNPMLIGSYVDQFGSRGGASGRSDIDVGEAYGRTRSDDRAEYRFGLGLVAPVADGGTAALITANSIRGARDPWLWAQDTFSVVAPVEIRSDQGLVNGALDTALALMIPTSGGGDVDFVWQFGLDLALEFFRDALAIGTRVNGVYVPTVSVVDNFQMSVEPYLAFGIFDHYIKAKFLMNLDEPRGPPFEDQFSWGMGIELGGSLYK